jgi:hypothetical protein
MDWRRNLPTRIAPMSATKESSLVFSNVIYPSLPLVPPSQAVLFDLPPSSDKDLRPIRQSG